MGVRAATLLSCERGVIELVSPPEFLTAEGSSSAEFFAAARAAVADDAKWGPEAVFVNLLLATSDYPAFLTLMKAEAEDAAETEAAEKSASK